MNIFLLGATPSISAEPGEDPMSKLAKTGGNTGNQLIAHGLLSQIAYDNLAWDHSINPKEVHDRFDMIVIAAANFLFPKFDFGGMAHYIEQADLPVAIVGLGAQSNNYDPKIDLMPGTDRFVKIVAERAVSIGVRGPYTRDVLAHRGVHNVAVTGCPSYYMIGADGPKIKQRSFDEIKRVSINASRDVITHSFDKEKMGRLVREIYREGISWNADFIAQTEQSEIILANRQSGPPSEVALKEIATFLNGVVSEQEARTWAADRVKVHFDVDEWLNATRLYDFVFGTRFHGCMAALQTGVPATVICHDTRTEDMCKFLGMPSVSIVELDRVNVGDLYQKFDGAMLQRRYDELYQIYRGFLQQNQLTPK